MTSIINHQIEIQIKLKITLKNLAIIIQIKTIISSMVKSLKKGERIEIRGFGSFSLRYRKPRVGRNPKSGESVNIEERYVPHFKPGKSLKERVKQK